MLRRKKRKLKVLFISEFFPSKSSINAAGGVEVRTYYLASYLAKKNTVYVITSRETVKPKQQKLLGIIIFRPGPQTGYTQKGNTLKRLAFFYSAVKVALSLDVDLVEGSGFIGQLVAFIVGKLKKVRIVAFIPDTFSDFSYHLGKVEGIILATIEKLILNNFWDGYIVISKTVKRKLIKLGIPQSKIKVIYCSVDYKKFPKKIVQKTKFPSICVISRFVSYKRIEDIINALSIIKQKFPEVVCFIIGRGEYLKKYKLQTRKLKLQKNIRFLGFISSHSEVQKTLKRSWVYCSASIVEGFGIATVEAMAAKTPFVISDIPVNKEITGGHGGLFFKSLNYSDLARKLIEVIGSKSYAKKLVKNDEKMISKYSITNMGQTTQNYYRKLMHF